MCRYPKSIFTLLVLLLTFPIFGKELVSVTDFGKNPGQLDMYKFVPTELPTTPRPLVVALHGCTQSVQAFANVTGWNKFATEKKFYVVYPVQRSANNFATCFNWAGEYGDTTNLNRGQGENQSIMEMINQMKKDHPIDDQQIYIHGFSSGGAMAALMMALFPDVFSGGAILAGIPYHCATSVPEAFSCMRQAKNMSAQQWGDMIRQAFPEYTGKYPAVTIWQGENDTMVSPKNQNELVKQWANVHNINPQPAKQYTVKNQQVAEYHNSNGEVVITTYLIKQLTHAISVDPGKDVDQGGNTGTYAQNRGLFSTYYIAKEWGLLSDENETPVPVENETPVPVENETPVPVENETPVPVDNETPVPVDNETPVPVDNETPVPVDNETPIENDGDQEIPAVTITSPQGHLPQKGPITITGTATDDQKIKEITLNIYHQPFGSLTKELVKTVTLAGEASWSYLLEIESLKNYNKYVVEVFATDTNNNQSEKKYTSFMLVHY